MNTCLIETSGRHVHLTQQAQDALFGEGYALRELKRLSQPGEFACVEKIVIVGPSGVMKELRVIAPLREYTQVELSASEANVLGIDAPVRESGNIAGTPGCKLIGPKGELELAQGCIVSCRHVHMNCEDAAHYGVADRSKVKVKSCNGHVFDDVLVRVKSTFKLAVHIDVDDAKAGGIGRGECPAGEIIA